MHSDKANGIQQEENSDRQKSSIFWRHILTLFPYLFSMFTALEIFMYVINEWTQFRIKTMYFPEMTEQHNFSACLETNHSDDKYIKYKKVQQDTSIWLIYYSMAHNIPSVFANMILPSYTDTYGRRFLFILSTSSILLRVAGIAVTIFTNQSFIYVVIANALSGLLGGSVFSIMCAAFSSIADITTSGNQRVSAIVFVETIFLLTTICSSLLSGYFIQTINLGFSNTAFICAGMLAACFLLVFFLPETLSKNKRVPRTPIIVTAKRTMEFYISKDFKGMRLCYILLLISFAVSMIANMQRLSLETLYFLGQPFCWDPEHISYFSFARHISVGVIGIGSLKIMQKCLSNEVIAIISSLSNAAASVLEAFATTTISIYFVPVLGAFSFLILPMIRGIISTMTSPDKQGSVFASISLIEVLSSVIATATANAVYSATVSLMNGFVFLVIASFCIIDCVLLLIYRYVKPKQKRLKRVSIQTFENEKEVHL